MNNGLAYRLGLPAWAHPSWQGTWFDNRPTTLSSYASVFNTVEGNTTFYRIPEREHVSDWARAVAGSDFQFCFKLPREITHERRFSVETVNTFLAAIAPLHAHLGPLLVQFPAWADAAHLTRFEPAFERITKHHRAVVEVRHPGFFCEPESLEPLLFSHGLGRVIYDSRPLYSGDTTHADVLAARHEKPDLPVLSTLYNDLALVRLILHPAAEDNDRWLARWAVDLVRMLADGVQVWMMIHCPNNLHCPPFARDFHERLRRALTSRDLGTLPALPDWPVPQQGALF